MAALHEAKYELRFGTANENEKAQRWARYQAALEVATMESGLTAAEIERVAASDFGTWVRQEKLPRTSGGRP
jgi:hypothetical protein